MEANGEAAPVPSARLVERGRQATTQQETPATVRFSAGLAPASPLCPASGPRHPSRGWLERGQHRAKVGTRANPGWAQADGRWGIVRKGR